MATSCHDFTPVQSVDLINALVSTLVKSAEIAWSWWKRRTLFIWSTQQPKCYGVYSLVKFLLLFYTIAPCANDDVLKKRFFMLLVISSSLSASFGSTRFFMLLVISSLLLVLWIKESNKAPTTDDLRQKWKITIHFLLFTFHRSSVLFTTLFMPI